MESILFLIVVIVLFTGAWSMRDKILEIIQGNHTTTVIDILDDPLIISPQMKESLTEFSVEHAFELRSMQPPELIKLLSCCANALRIFEKRVEQISQGYEHYEKAVDGRPSIVKEIESNASPLAKKIYGPNPQAEMNRKRLAPIKEDLDEQAEQVIILLDELLNAKGNALNVIPEKYRLSIILDMMCGYLSDGEVDSWEGCIKTFKEDTHRMLEMAYFQDFSQSLERIGNNTSRIAFFSAVTAANTW